MPDPQSASLYRRKSLDQVTAIPDAIISVYVVERHIWADDGAEAARTQARATRQANRQTVEDLSLIHI